MGARHAIRRMGCIGIAWAMTVATSVGAAEGPQPEALLKGGPNGAVPSFADAGRAQERRRMVREQVAGRDVSDRAVLDAMRRVPRHRFVPAGRRATAYADNPLPIGHGQTISQPYIVGFMTAQLDLESHDRVLEVGTGSGYHAAVAAQLAEEVVTIEIVRPLAETAAQRLQRMGYGNITVLHGDGYYGYAEKAPFDAIIVTAAADHVPPPLVDQLVADGRMIIPVARGGWTQNLLVVEKNSDGSTSTRNLMPVRFVPLTGDH